MPTYSHVCALAWRKVWQAIKEQFEATRGEYAHSLHDSIMKIRISTLKKDQAKIQCHLFYDGANGRGDAIVNPLDRGKAAHVNAKVERAVHADQVHRMVVHTFTALGIFLVRRANKGKKVGILVAKHGPSTTHNHNL